MEYIEIIAGLVGGLSIGIIVLIIMLLNPEKIEIWSSLIWRLLSRLGGIFKGAHKQYVKHDLQGRVNHFTKALSKDAPFIASKRISVEWIGSDVTRKSFLEDGKVIIRLRRDDPMEMNFVHGAYMFITTSLLFKAKRYISPSQREAIDLYVATNLVEKEKPAVVAYFLKDYLHPKLSDTGSKMSQYFDWFSKIDTGGLFYPVMLQELDFLGDKVFGKRKDDTIVNEVNSMIEFLVPISTRKIGEEGNLDFKQAYCRFAIVIVGKSYKVTSAGEVYIDYIRNHLIPINIETVYILGLAENSIVIQNVCEALQDTYDTCSTRKSKVVLRYGDDKVERNQYLAVLRLKGLRLYQPSE